MKSKADLIVDTCIDMARHYDKDDPMRWPFIVGVMTVKIRELAFLLEQRDAEISNLHTQIENGESNHD